MKARILLTGFRPFGPHAANPSEQVVERIAARPPDGVSVESLVLPVEYRTAFAPVRAALDAGRIDAVLHLGLAANRPDLQVERFALNWRGGPQADESGERLDGEPVDPAGPAARIATVPVEGLAAAIRAAGLPCTASSHAGTFLCNQVLYQTLAHADRRAARVRAAFVHLPEPGPEGGRPDLDLLVRGVEAALRFLASLPRPRPRRASRPPPASRTPPRTPRRGRTIRKAGRNKR